MLRQVWTVALVVSAVFAGPSLAPAQESQQPGGRKQVSESPSVKRVLIPASRFMVGSSLPENDPRRNLRITLAADKEEYFLGENIVLAYRIKNCGNDTFYFNHWERKNEPFFINLGGDTRNNARRALRFEVEAIDQHGRKAIDPYPNPWNFGGMSAMPTFKPGDEFCEDLQLMRYCEPAGAGTYTIRVFHDLGWEQAAGRPTFGNQWGSDIPTGLHNAPIVTATVRLRMPDPRQARQVVAAMLKLPAESGRTWGRHGRPYADFALLRYPVYLPIVRELAEKGDARGLEALGAMAFPQATAALLDLANHQDRAIASKAEELLLDRMPFVVLDERPSRERYLAERSWRVDLQDRALQIGWRLLAQPDREGRIRGGRIIQILGGRDDLPKLIDAMDKLLRAYQDDDTEQRAWLRPATVSETLSEAAADLIRRGARPPATAGTPGQAAAFLAGLKASKDFRPAGWQGTTASLLKHDIPFLRALALEDMPLPLGDAAAELVAARIQDPYLPVQGSACDLARRSKLARFRQPLTDVVRSATNDWVLQSAFHSAAACGADMDRLLEILVDRLEPHRSDRNMVLLSLLIDGSIKWKSYGAGEWQPVLGDLQRAWREFIAAHRQALRAGRRFEAAQPPLSRAMFPPKFQFSPPGKPPWPDWGP